MTTPTNTGTSRPRRQPSIAKQQRHWDAKNLVAARVITSAPEQHTELQRDWARRFVARQKAEGSS